MLLTNAIQKRINDLCNERNITMNKLCTICGITQSTLNNIMNVSAKHSTILTVIRICRGLEIRVMDFFDDPMFDDIDDD